MNKRTGNLSSAQKTELLEFMERNPALQKGKFTNEFTFKKAQLLWVDISNTLNSLPGAHKDWRQWRKAWQDMKVSAKKKNSQIRNFRRGTGGGPPILPPLNENEEAIVQMIGTTAIEGHPEISESDTTFVMNVIPEGIDFQDFDHDYNILVVDNDANDNKTENIPDQNKESTTLKENKIIKSQSEIKHKRKNKVRVERLNHTIAATEKLAQQSEMHMKQTGEYQQRKLNLYEKDILVKNRIAVALENISVSLSELKKSEYTCDD